MNDELIFLIKKAIGSETRNSFCKMAGISAGNFSRIMRGQRPSPDILLRISCCSKETVSYEQLMSAAGYTHNSGRGDIAILGAISAGTPIEAIEASEGRIRLDYDCSGAKEGNFALKVVGDSMDAANIPDGSVVVVRPQTSLDDGDIGAFRINGDVTVKRSYRKGENIVLMPVSTNPEHYPQIYAPEDDVALLGKVVMVLIDFE